MTSETWAVREACISGRNKMMMMMMMMKGIQSLNHVLIAGKFGTQNAGKLHSETQP